MKAKASKGGVVVTVCCLSPNRLIVGEGSTCMEDSRQRSIMPFHGLMVHVLSLKMGVMEKIG